MSELYLTSSGSFLRVIRDLLVTNLCSDPNSLANSRYSNFWQTGNPNSLMLPLRRLPGGRTLLVVEVQGKFPLPLSPFPLPRFWKE